MITKTQRALTRNLLTMWLLLSSQLIYATQLTDIRDGIQKAPELASGGSQQVQTYSGAFSYQIPIETPAYFEIAPKLQLGYSSSAGQGVAGRGWSLSGLSTIERSGPRKTAPTWKIGNQCILDDSCDDAFLLDGVMLLHCKNVDSPSCRAQAGGTHTTKKESYSRVKYLSSSDRWQVTQNNGNTLEYAPLQTTVKGTFRWGVVKILDTHGNRVTINWSTPTGKAFQPKSLYYGSHQILLHYESREDHLSEADGLSVVTMDSRLKTIEVKSNWRQMRAYGLSYSNQGSTSRSKLISVQEFGKDYRLDSSKKIVSGSALPASEFTYFDQSSSFNVNQKWTLPTKSKRFIDVNGDGFVDIAELDDVYLNQGDGSWLKQDNYFPIVINGQQNEFAPNIKLLDIDGDGLIDILHGLDADRNRVIELDYYRNTRHGFEKLDPPSMETLFSVWNGESSYQSPMDLNGDGRTDFYFANSNGTNNGIYINQNYHFAKEDDVPFDLGFSGWDPTEGSFGFQRAVHLGDFNGDGLVDGYLENRSCNNTKEINFNVGGSYADFAAVWQGDGSWYTHGIPVNVFGPCGNSAFSAQDAYRPYQINAVDFNADGLDDFVWITSSRINVAINHGTNHPLERMQIDIPLNPNGGFMSFMLKDFNGDGIPDIYGTDSRDRNLVFLNRGKPELMKSVKTTLGARVDIDYEPSTKWQNSHLPQIIWTATKVTSHSGTGLDAVQTFAYAGGMYDPDERQFLGFRYVKETLPKENHESQSPYREMWFKQDIGSFTKLERLNTYDGQGRLRASETFEYLTNGASLPYTSLMSRKSTYRFEGTGTCNAWETNPSAPSVCQFGQRGVEEFRYDPFGNLIWHYDYGDFDRQGDEFSKNHGFYPNLGNFITSLPGWDAVWQDNPTKARSRTRYHYDGAQTYTAPPVKGNLTKKGLWLNSPASWIYTTQEFDRYGNVTATIDPIGARSTTQYDRYGIHPTSIIDPMNHRHSLSWDYACDQLRSFRDANQRTTQLTYDVHCRKLNIQKPSGASTSYSYHNLGQPTEQYVRSVATRSFGATANHESKNYYDGLGQSYKTSKTGPHGKDIISRKQYTLRGQSGSESALFFAGEAAYFVRHEFDSLDRPIKVINPNGSKKLFFYGAGWTEEINEEGQKMRKYIDFNDRVIKRSEFHDGRWIEKTYSYDPVGLLTKMTDHSGNEWHIEYDSLGRKSRYEDPDAGVMQYYYDIAGRMIRMVDNKGQHTVYEHDLLGRKTRKIIDANGPSRQEIIFTYDQVISGEFNIGMMTGSKNNLVEERFGYDVHGNKFRRETTVDGRNYRMIHNFDAAGSLRAEIYPDGQIIARHYNNAGWLQSIPGFVNDIQYNARGEMVRIINANGTVNRYTYDDESGFLEEIRNEGSTLIDHFSYQVDLLGKIVGVNSNHGTQSYRYDDLNRLVESRDSQRGTQSFGYDDLGNITYNSAWGTYLYSEQAEETEEEEEEEATPTFSWQNVDLPEDVNGDGRVTLSDAMIIVAELRSQGAHALAALTAKPPNYFDVNLDGRVTISDAMVVIARLRRR